LKVIESRRGKWEWDKKKAKETVKKEAEELRNWGEKQKFITREGKGILEKKILEELYEGERTEMSGWNKKIVRRKGIWKSRKKRE